MAGERDLALDPTTWDLDLSGGGSLTTGEGAIRQEIHIRLLTFAGEYFLDTDRGLPWLTWASSKASAATLRQVEALVLAEILATKGVARIVPPGVSAVYDVDSRTITATAEAVTDTGLLLVIEEEIAP